MRGPHPGGGTLRDHLLVAQQNGSRSPDLQQLDVPELPYEYKHVWKWFDELQMARGSSGFGVSAITYSEIGAWAMLTGRTPTPNEVQLLKDLDGAYLASVVERQKNAPKEGATL